GRVNDVANIALNGGTLRFDGASAGSTETLGIVTVGGGNLSNTIQSVNNGGTTILTMAQFNFGGGASTVNLVRTHLALSATGPNRLRFANAPPGLTNGIFPSATVPSAAGALDFAPYASSPEGFSFIALPAAAYVTDLSEASAASNVKLTTPGTYTLSTPLT